MIRALLVLGCLSTLMIVGCQGWNLRGQDLSPFLSVAIPPLPAKTPAAPQKSNPGDC